MQAWVAGARSPIGLAIRRAKAAVDNCRVMERSEEHFLAHAKQIADESHALIVLLVQKAERIADEEAENGS